MEVIIFGDTIYQFFQYIATAIVKIFKEQLVNKPFFVFYDNINFYKKVRKQHIYNQNHQINYTTGSIYFIKSDKYLYSNFVDYNAINSFKLKNFLSNDSELKDYCKSI